MNNEKLIISIKDFRSLTGETTAHLSDDEVVESIMQLDFLAEMYVKRAIAGKEKADTLEKQD